MILGDQALSHGILEITKKIFGCRLACALKPFRQFILLYAITVKSLAEKQRNSRDALRVASDIEVCEELPDGAGRTRCA